MARDVCTLLGKRIRELRKARGWRQLDLAEQAGINENYVSDLELGRKEACLRILCVRRSGLSAAARAQKRSIRGTA
ncbi:MAG TPA: helix-turn-helix transcriptional regulator [Acidobacteriaceae bacterium]